MEISAVMNIHELAMNNKIQQQSEEKEKKDQIKQLADAREKTKTHDTNKGQDETSVNLLSNIVNFQEELQALTTRVERQVDAQAGREIVDQSQAEGTIDTTPPRELGKMVDVIT